MEELNIESAKYAGFGEEIYCIQIVVDGKSMDVPLNPANRHYAEIMRQVEAGTLTIAEASAEG